MLAVIKVFTRALAATALVACLGILAALSYLEYQLPSVQALREVKLQVPLRVMSQDGKLIAEFGEKRRIPLKLHEVPLTFIQALLATEDRRFYEHRGVDLRGIVRAAVNLVTKASREQGGSTITMQVARHFFLSRKKTYLRKTNEILLALKIEKELSKDEILELYLNTIYLGKRAYGLAAAAEVYYGVPVARLNLSQMAMLAGLPQAPSAINPLSAPEAALKRRKHVLERMLNHGFITEAQFAQADASPLNAHYHAKTIEVEAPYVAEMVRQDLVNRYGEEVYSSGYVVTTTLDSRLQAAANAALRRAVIEYDQRHGYRRLTQHLPLPPSHNAEHALESFQTALKLMPTYGPLQPAVVLSINAQQAWIYTKDGQYGALPLRNLLWARPKHEGVSEQSFKVRDIVSARELIYVERLRDQSWRLAQVPEAEAALVALSANKAAILALVGGFDYGLSNFNRITQAVRQPGSIFKPFIYAAALEEGMSLATVVNDAPLVLYDPVSGPWRPQNDKNRFYGPTRLRVSLARSQNLVAVRLLMNIGVPRMLRYAADFGFDPMKLPPYPSLALGTGNTTPLELASAYTVLANGGFRLSPYLIAKIADERGTLIYEQQSLKAAPFGWALDETPFAPRAISAQTAYFISSALQDAIRSGTGRRALSLGRRDIAGKTGTTNDKLDAWYSGYNRSLVATAWLGFDEPRTLKEYGSQAALPLWMYFMDEALKGKPDEPLLQPPGVISVRIDPLTGLLARSGQKEAIYEYFIEGREPKRTASPPIDLMTTGGEGHIESEPLF